MLAAGACADDDTTPIDPTPVTFTETFTGVLTPNGAFSHPFAAQASGNVTATVKVLSPDSATVVGLSLGSWNGAVCAVLLPIDRATQGTILLGTATSPGSYCVRIYDAAGTVAEPTSYELEVVHP
jgi:hypothetical protein